MSNLAGRMKGYFDEEEEKKVIKHTKFRRIFKNFSSIEMFQFVSRKIRHYSRKYITYTHTNMLSTLLNVKRKENRLKLLAR